MQCQIAAGPPGALHAAIELFRPLRRPQQSGSPVHYPYVFTLCTHAGFNASPVHRSTSRASSAPQRRLVSAHAERQQQQQQRSAPTGLEWLLRAFTQKPARHQPHREQHPAQPAAAAVGQKSRVATGSAPLPPPFQDQHRAAPPLHHQQQLHTAAGYGHASNGHGPIKASASQLLSGVPLEQMVQRRQAERQLQRGQQSMDGSGSGSWDEDFNPKTKSSSSSSSSNGHDVNGSISAEGGQSAGSLAVTSPEAAIALAAYQDAIAHRRSVPVVFKLKHVVQPGQRLKVVGGHKSLGESLQASLAAHCSTNWLQVSHTAPVWFVCLPLLRLLAFSSCSTAAHFQCQAVQGAGHCTMPQSCSAAAATCGRQPSSCRQVCGQVEAERGSPCRS
jgi:hypothetical protein